MDKVVLNIIFNKQRIGAHYLNKIAALALKFLTYDTVISSAVRHIKRWKVWRFTIFFASSIYKLW